jgi:hypothetical protein
VKLGERPLTDIRGERRPHGGEELVRRQPTWALKQGAEHDMLGRAELLVRVPKNVLGQVALSLCDSTEGDLRKEIVAELTERPPDGERDTVDAVDNLFELLRRQIETVLLRELTGQIDAGPAPRA